jgi:hypothetical protein
VPSLIPCSLSIILAQLRAINSSKHAANSPQQHVEQQQQQQHQQQQQQIAPPPLHQSRQLAQPPPSQAKRPPVSSPIVYTLRPSSPSAPPHPHVHTLFTLAASPHNLSSASSAAASSAAASSASAARRRASSPSVPSRSVTISSSTGDGPPATHSAAGQNQNPNPDHFLLPLSPHPPHPLISPMCSPCCCSRCRSHIQVLSLVMKPSLVHNAILLGRLYQPQHIAKFRIFLRHTLLLLLLLLPKVHRCSRKTRALARGLRALLCRAEQRVKQDR